MTSLDAFLAIGPDVLTEAWDSLWATEGASVLIGAVLTVFGAFLGYSFARRQRTQERTSKQTMLLENLKRELSLLGQETSPSDADAMHLRLPTRLNVIPRLLDGELLEDESYRDLADRLIVLEQMVGRYNDWVALTNDAQLGGRTRGEVVQMQQTARQMRSAIGGIRKEVAALLGATESELDEMRRLLESSAAARRRDQEDPPEPVSHASRPPHSR